MTNKYDYINRKLYSQLFRLLIILYSVFLVLSRNNYFVNYVYFLAIIPYVIIYYYTLFKDNFFSQVRLLNDFLLIGLVSYNKSIDAAIVGYIFLPIVNASNHSGQKKSWLLYLLSFLVIVIVDDFQIKFSTFLIIFIFQLIGFIDSSRQRFLTKVEELNTSVDSFFENIKEYQKSYKIYIDLIHLINSKPFLKYFKPKFSNIICFRIQNNKLRFVNSSEFIWNYRIEAKHLEKIFTNISKNEILEYIPISINNKLYDSNFLYYVPTKNNKYIFFLNFKSTVKSNIIWNLYYIYLLKSPITRIASFLELKDSLNEIKNQNLSVLKSKFYFVQNAEKAMHFIKNKFTPLDNFIEMSQDFIDGEMDEEEKTIYYDELKNVKRNFELIIQHSKNILKKSDNPFHVTELESKSPSELLSICRSIWLDYFDSFNYEMNWVLKGIVNYSVSYNDEGLHILLTDWIANIRNYSSGDNRISFFENAEFYCIEFHNSIKESKRIDIEKLVSDFNSNDRGEILRRKSHGVFFIKSFIEEMKISGILDILDDYLIFRLMFKKTTKNENSNI